MREVAVQGVSAVTQVIAALRELDRLPHVDVIVIARGGGSLEDLLPFSDESLLREVSAALTPVVSAIGHEPDSPLLDLVADLRAATPTDAARRIVPDVEAELDLVRTLRDRSRRVLGHRLDTEHRSLAQLRQRPVLADPGRELARGHAEVTALIDRSRRCVGHALTAAAADLGHSTARVRALSPAATLERGYAVAQLADGSVLRSPKDAPRGTTLRLRVRDGDLEATAAT